MKLKSKCVTRTDSLDILSRGFPVFDDAVEMLRFVGTHIDITERKRHEAQLGLAAAVFGCAHEGILVSDLDGEIVMVNPAFTAITGFDDAELIGRRLGALRSGHHDDSFYREMWRDIHETGNWQGEIWNCRKSGEVYPQWLTISTVRDNKGVPTNYVAMSRRELKPKLRPISSRSTAATWRRASIFDKPLWEEELIERLGGLQRSRLAEQGNA